MLITSRNGTVGTYPTTINETTLWRVEFILPGGRVFVRKGLESLAEAEKVACETALKHPDLQYFLDNAEWV